MSGQSFIGAQACGPVLAVKGESLTDNFDLSAD